MGNQVDRAFQLFNLLQNTSSRNEKEKLLRELSNDCSKELFFRAFNPFINYHVKKVPTPSSFSKDNTKDGKLKRFTQFLHLLELLDKRKITGNEAISQINIFFNGCTEEEFNWYLRVLQKNMRIGVTEKTINKIFTNLIPEFECMLAEKLEKDEDLPDYCYVEPKLDGMRLLAFLYEKDDVILKSRNGKVLYGFDKLEQEIKENLLPGYVYDGEIINGAFSDLMTQAFRKSGNKTGIFNMFDMLKIEEFDNRSNTDVQLNRKRNLITLMKDVDKCEFLSVLPHKGVFDTNDEIDKKAIYKMFDFYKKLGFEGAIVKDINAMYEFKRTKSMIKMKSADTYDLRVVDTIEGTGKYEGMLGAIVVNFNGNAVHVGSGFKDDERIRFWQKKDEIMGKIVQVKAQEVTINKKGTKSLRFPVFEGVRLDK